MIEARHALQIDVGIDSVWDYVKDLRQWAEFFPGCQECQVIDDHNSRWVIKIGAGGMVKTVTVLVNVDKWDGPESVLFSYQLESEPVIGNGSYSATMESPSATRVELFMRVEGSGQMAPMWEAMSKPLLPQLAQTFSTRLKNSIETDFGIAPAPRPSLWVRFWRWLKSFWSSPH